MVGVTSAVFLIGMLLLVHFSTKHVSIARAPKEDFKPLDQDERLLLPWAGHASNVFSLTALFGGYTVIASVLGLPALIGLATGGVLALLLMRRVIVAARASSFHAFLSSRTFSRYSDGNEVYWVLLTGVQLLLAVSEIVILREVALHGFGLPPRHATTFALTLALVAYFYSLIGRYEGIFRTDVIQLLFMIIMCLTSAGYALSDISTAALSPNNVLFRPLGTDAWTGGSAILRDFRHPLNFSIGAIAGSSLLLASPDTWKRIFLTSSGGSSSRSRRSFWGLILAGTIPFALLLPALLIMPRPDIDNPQIFAPLHATIGNKIILVSITLGMMSSFLSTFDSALISATHLLLCRSERQLLAPRRSAGWNHFHFFLGGGFLVIGAGSLAFILGTGNPYLPGVIILGMYAILGGTMLGTSLGSCRPSGKMSKNATRIWPPVVALVGWLLLLLSFDGVLERPLAEQLLLVPAAAGIYVAFSFVSYFDARKG